MPGTRSGLRDALHALLVMALAGCARADSVAPAPRPADDLGAVRAALAAYASTATVAAYGRRVVAVDPVVRRGFSGERGTAFSLTEADLAELGRAAPAFRWAFRPYPRSAGDYPGPDTLVLVVSVPDVRWARRPAHLPPGFRAAPELEAWWRAVERGGEFALVSIAYQATCGDTGGLERRHGVWRVRLWDYGQC